MYRLLRVGFAGILLTFCACRIASAQISSRNLSFFPTTFGPTETITITPSVSWARYYIGDDCYDSYCPTEEIDVDLEGSGQYSDGASWDTGEWETSTYWNFNDYSDASYMNPVTFDAYFTAWYYDYIFDEYFSTDDSCENYVTPNYNLMVPSGESISFAGWDDTYGEWAQTLQGDGSGTFSGRTVHEANGGTGTDSCWFSGSTFSPFDSITGGTWGIQSDQTFDAYDEVGYGSGQVSYYRSQGRAPCGTSFTQDMYINRPGSSDVIYQSNTLGAGIDSTTISSTKNGTQSKAWP